MSRFKDAIVAKYGGDSIKGLCHAEYSYPGRSKVMGEKWLVEDRAGNLVHVIADDVAGEVVLYEKKYRKEPPGYEKIVKEAKLRWGHDDDVQMEDRPAVEIVEGGAWVDCRVWVSREDIDG